MNDTARRIRKGLARVAMCGDHRVLIQAIELRDVEPVDAVSAERREDERPVERKAQRLTDMLARVPRVACDERNVDHCLESGELTGHRQTPRGVRAAVRSPDRRYQVRCIGERLGVRLVDPIPREIGNRDGRHAGGRGGGTSERRRVGDDEPRVVFAEQGRFLSSEIRQPPVERLRLLNRRARVEPQAVDLHDAGITRAGDEPHRDTRGAVEQPVRRRRANDDREVGTGCTQRIDDFDLAGRVAEAVTGNVEDD